MRTLIMILWSQDISHIQPTISYNTEEEVEKKNNNARILSINPS